MFCDATSEERASATLGAESLGVVPRHVVVGVA